MLEQRHVDEVVRIVAAGGGIVMDAQFRQVNELVRIASAAGTSKARVTFTGLDVRTTEELITIAVAGKGCVEFA